VSALEKTYQNHQIKSEAPAEKAGILETVHIHPAELVASGIARIHELIKMYGEVRQTIVYEGEELDRKPVSIDVYKI